MNCEVTMSGFKRLPALLGATVLLGGTFMPAMAHDLPRAPEAPSAASAEPAMDPVMRALLIGLAARMLTEAARSSDPMATLGDSLERALTSALRSPASTRMIESLMAQAFKDVPVELREPLALFAGSMLESARREMLDNRRPRSSY